MDLDQLHEVVTAELTDAQQYFDEIRGGREEGVNAYDAAPYEGDDEIGKGFTTIIDRTVMDTVEWILPQLMTIFHGTDRAVEFAPSGIGDEQAAKALAKEQTEYVNFVYNVENDGFNQTYSVFKDALTSRLGIWKVWVENDKEITINRYEGHTEDEVLIIDDEDGIEVRDLEISGENELGEPLYSFETAQTRVLIKERVESVHPEEFLFERSARSVDTSNFFAHRFTMTRSDLVEAGHDKDFVAELPESNFTIPRRHESKDRTTRVDSAMQRVEVAECYIRVDFDGDGIAEWRKVLVAGGSDNQMQILSNDPINDHPFVVVTPIPSPHSIIGKSVADLVTDLQRIKTEITRQLIDGLKLTNRSRLLVNRNKVENMEALTDNSPGSIIVVNGDNAVNRMDETFQGVSSALPVLQYVDSIGESRTGVSATSSGSNPDLLNNQTATAVNQVMSAAKQKVELIARIFAETGFRKLFRKLNKLSIQHQERRNVVLGGKATEIDPRAWRADAQINVIVGLGTGNKELKLASLSQLLTIQQSLQQQGSVMVGEPEIYNTVSEYVAAVGFPSVSPFLKEPIAAAQKAAEEAAQNPPPPPPPDPLVQSTQIQAEAKSQEVQMKTMADLEKARMIDDRERDKVEGQQHIELVRLGEESEERDLQAIRDLDRFNEQGAGNGAA